VKSHGTVLPSTTRTEPLALPPLARQQPDERDTWIRYQRQMYHQARRAGNERKAAWYASVLFGLGLDPDAAELEVLDADGPIEIPA
jgi:hypothetical protein